MPNNVLFINKSAKSKHLTRSEGFERSKIFSHVQQSPYTLTEDGSIREWNYASTELPYVDGASDSSSGSSFTKKGSGKGKRSSASARRRSNERETRAVIIRRSSPTSVLDTAKLDPFDCAVVAMDGQMTDLLKACRYHNATC
jgi:hypothetical protein